MCCLWKIMATYILPEQYLSISEKLNLFKDFIMLDTESFTIEGLSKAPTDSFIQVEGVNMPVILVSDFTMEMYGKPYRVANTGGLAASTAMVDGKHVPVILVFKEIFKMISTDTLRILLSHEEGHIVNQHLDKVLNGQAELNRKGISKDLQLELEADRYAAEKHGAQAVASALDEMVYALLDNVLGSKSESKIVKKLSTFLAWLTLNTGQMKARRKALLS